MVGKLNLTFSDFKQPYTHFHIYVFQKTTNNITQTPLSNRPIFRNATVALPVREGPFHPFLVSVSIYKLDFPRNLWVAWGLGIFSTLTTLYWLSKSGDFFTKKIPFFIGCLNRSSSQMGAFLMLLYQQIAHSLGGV